MAGQNFGPLIESVVVRSKMQAIAIVLIDLKPASARSVQRLSIVRGDQVRDHSEQLGGERVQCRGGHDAEGIR